MWQLRHHPWLTVFQTVHQDNDSHFIPPIVSQTYNGEVGFTPAIQQRVIHFLTEASFRKPAILTLLLILGY